MNDFQNGSPVGDNAGAHADQTNRGLSEPGRFIIYEILLFFLAFAGVIKYGVLTYIFASLSVGLLAAMTVLRFTPVNLIGTLLGLITAGIFNFSPMIFAAAVLYIFPFIPLCICVRRSAGRGITALLTSAAFLLSLGVMLCVDVIMTKGSLSIQSFSGYFSDIAYALSEYITTIYKQYYTLLEENTSAGALDALKLNEIASSAEEFSKQIISQVYFSSVAAVSVICLALGYASTYILRTHLLKSNMLLSRFRDGWKLSLSLASAIVLFASSVAAVLFTLDSSPVIYVTALNIRIIMSSIYLVYGFNVLCSYISKREEVLGGYFKVTAIIMMILFCSSIYIVLPVIGFIAVVSNEYNKRKNAHKH
ncbi:MAG: hypothetical protein VB118_01710 [Oscillospiraceae bacterium]|nr:hypothetical protein [Oscillospiraceae bacterium]